MATFLREAIPLLYMSKNSRIPFMPTHTFERFDPCLGNYNQETRLLIQEFNFQS